MNYRTCSKCGERKPETAEFFRRRGHHCRGGLRPECRECSNARDREYVRANRQRRADYRAANAEKVAATRRATEAKYLQTEQGQAARKRAREKYAKSERGKLVFRMAQHRRKARLAQVLNDFTDADWQAILTKFRHECAYCGKPEDLLTVLYQEHVVSISMGGPNTASNVVPACRPCNSRKFQTDVVEWYQRQEFFSPQRLAAILAHCAAGSTDTP